MTTTPSAEAAASPEPSPSPGLVLHLGGPDASPELLTGALRTGFNALADLPPGTVVEVVVQGPAVRLLAAGSPLAQEISAAAARIKILACGNSLRSAELESQELLPGVLAVPAAVGHLTRRQWQHWAYVRV